MKYSILVIVLFSMTSCYSYKIFPKEYRDFEYKGEKQVAFVTNPELSKEYKILEESGIFSLSTDTLGKSYVRVVLKPERRGFVCGQPILASAFTLGQLPVYFPDRYQFQFEVVNNRDTTLHQFELQVAQRIWFWDLFTFDKNFSKKAGKALLANYYSSNMHAPVSGSTSTAAASKQP